MSSKYHIYPVLKQGKYYYQWGDDIGIYPTPTEIKILRVHYVKNKLKKLELKPNRPQDSMARGKYYDDFVKEFGESLVDKIYTHQQVADKMGVSRSLVTKMYISYLEDK